MPANFQIGATFDKSQIDEGFDAAGASAQTWADQLEVIFGQAAGSSKRAFKSISDDSKAAAASVSSDQMLVAEAARALVVAQNDVKNSQALLKAGTIDEATAMRLLAASLDSAAAAQRNLRDKQAAASGVQTSDPTAGFRAAWQAELVAQDQLIAKNAEVGRARELAALKADILARSELALAETEELSAAASGRLAEGASHVVPEMAAASGAIRVFQGALPVRAVENFLTKTLGLGPIIAMAFPVVGAIALGEMLFKIGTDLYDTEQKGEHAGEAIKKAFDGLNEGLVSTNEDLLVTDDRLENEIAKLEKKPGDGLQVGLDEATQAAHRLGNELDKDLDKVQQLIKDNQVSFFSGLLSGAAETKDASNLLIKVQQDIENVRKSYDATVDQARSSGNKENIAQAEEAKAAALVKVYKEATDKVTAARNAAQQAQDARSSPASTFGARTTVQGAGVSFSSGRDNSSNVNLLNGGLNLLGNQQTEIGLSMRKQADEAQKGALESTKDVTGLQKKADEERFKQIEEGLNRLKSAGPVTAQAELEYWQAAESSFSKASSEYRSILAKEGELTQQIIRKVHEGIEAQKKKDTSLDSEQSIAVDKGNEAMSRWSEMMGQNLTRTGEQWSEYWRAVTKGQEITAAIADNISMAQLKSLEASGGITKFGAAQVEAAIHAREHAEALKALEAELANLEKSASRDAIGNVDNPKQAAEIQQVQNQIQQEKGKGAVQGVQDAATIQTQLVQPYTQAFSTIESSWMTAQRSMLNGQKSFAQGMQQMWGGIAVDAIQNVEKVLFNVVRTQLLSTIAHKSAAATNLATDSTAASASVSIDALAAIKKMNHSAAVAAGKAWGAFADIPVVGPELGAIAAAATYAGVMALASFDTGTAYVPHDGIAMIHKGESVLPPPQTSVLMNALAGGGAGSGGDTTNINFNGNHNFSAGGSDFKSQWNAHERHIATSLKKMRRDGKI